MKFVPLTLMLVHKLFLEGAKEPHVDYYWSEGADPNLNPQFPMTRQLFVPNGTMVMTDGDETRWVYEYLQHKTLKQPYFTGHLKPSSMSFWLLGKHKFYERRNETLFIESRVQICEGPLMNSLSDNCIYGRNWVDTEKQKPTGS